MSSMDARLAAASSFILQSPPGEVNDVFNDVRALVGDDQALESGILPALERYNIEQCIVADLPDKTQLMICDVGRVPDAQSRFIEPATATSWQFDHLNLTASEPIPVETDEVCEAIRAELQRAANDYAKEHFADGVSKVFTVGQNRLAKTEEPQSAVAGAETVDTNEQAASSPKLGHENSETQEEEDKIPVETGEAAAAVDRAEPPAEDAEMTSASTPAPDVEADQDAIGDSATPAVVAQNDDGADMGSGPNDGKSQSLTEQEPAQQQEAVALSKKYNLYFVGNKYNPSNYWTGRWRSSYDLDLTATPCALTGDMQLNVHFFEQGNVQLSTKHQVHVDLPASVTSETQPAEIAKSMLKAISKAEQEYQLELNDAYRDLSDKTFRSLRRALPVTRQKMDWAKVANYKLGMDWINSNR